jgi:GntR family transcriptional regulator, carbon starvation induced regulator
MSKARDERVDRARSEPLLAEDADTLTDVVRMSLRRAILSLSLAPGARVTLRELRARYGVGATPVREALWSLSGEGLIQYEPQAGFRVADASCDRLTGLSRLRRRVEPWMLGRAMQNPDRSWVAGVEAAYARLAPIDALVGDLRAVNSEWEDAHRLFHLSLLAGANMPSVLHEISRWHEETNRYRRLTSPTLGDTVGNKGDHDVLYEAVVAGDAARAVATLGRHIRDTTARHLSYFERSPRAAD